MSKKVALVTGAGRGLGRELAVALAQAGYRVAVADIADTGEETVQLITARGGDGFFCKTDITQQGQVQKLVNETRTRYGPITLLINNAIISPVVSVDSMSMEDWDQVMAVNLRGPVLLTKLVLSDLRSVSGSVVNILSGAAMGASALAYMSAYCASKAALSSFTIALAQEEEKAGVRATAVWVGMTDTAGARTSMSQLAPLIDTRFQDMAAALRPAEQVAAGIVHMVEHTINEYHGMAVEDHILMEEAGLVEANLSVPSDHTPAISGNLKELAAGVLKVVEENEAKLLELPAFIRPLARRGFQSKSGKNFVGWHQLLEPVVMGGNPGSELKELLPGLIQYIENSPREVAKFTRDEDTLRQVTAVARQQAAVVKALQKAL